MTHTPKQILPNLRLQQPLEDTPARKRQRALAGALYGLAAASAFVLVAATIDRLTFPSLPIYIDWAQAALTWLVLGATLTGVGVLAGWFSEGLTGIGIGAAAIAASVMLLSLSQSDYPLPPKIIMFIILSLPLTAASVPVALGLRWLARQHMRALQRTGWALARGLAVTLLLAALGGGVPGLLTRMSPQAERAMLHLHATLTAPQPPNQSPYSPFRAATRLDEHWGAPFEMRQVRSITSTEGYDIRVVYPDGYSFWCTVVVYADYDPYVRACREK